MNRRGFLGRSLAAMAAAVTLAPAAQTEAAPAESPWGVTFSTQQLETVREALAEQRAEAFNTGYDLATARVESRQALGLPLERGADSYDLKITNTGPGSHMRVLSDEVRAASS